MSRHHRTGILRRLRGDGSLIRALLLALTLQILVPMLGMLPGTASAAPSSPSITVCTAHGIVTMVADADGNWVQQDAPKQAGIACSFCLPLLSGHAGPVADVAVPLPARATDERLAAGTLAIPARTLPPGSSSPRAPPAFC
jgi:hypothetical protein